MHTEAINLFSAETLSDPYPAYEALRNHAPVHHAADMNIYVVTRYDLVREAIRDTATYSSRYDSFLAESQRLTFEAASPEVQAQLVKLMGEMTETPPTMLTLDEPEHTRYRSLVNQLFVASRIRQAEPSVRQVIDTNLSSFASKGSVEFMGEFAMPVPLTIIADRLGIPAEDREFFDVAANAAANALRLTPLDGEQMLERAQLALDLQKLLIRLVEARRSEPREDMISILANSQLEPDGRPLTHGECLSILNQFLVAGHETTSSGFGWGMLQLCRQPELQDRIRGNPALIRTFVEEALRIEAPVQGLPRLVTRDTELGGVALPAGSMIMLRYGAANRDERQFPEPDQINIERQKAGQQLAFGAGVHFCIGAPLARQELNLGFLALLDRMGDIRLDENFPPPQAEISFILRNLPRLHLQFAPIG